MGSLVPRDWIAGILEETGESRDVDLTVAEAGSILGRAPSTIRTWAGQGRLVGAYRLAGREWRIPRAALRSLRDAADLGSEDPSDPSDLSEYRRRIRTGGKG